MFVLHDYHTEHGAASPLSDLFNKAIVIMTKQEQSALKMAGFIKSQTLVLLDKLDQLELDSCADECEEFHELAEKLYLHLRKELEK